MTTFTITTDTYIDDLTPKTGGDTYVVNGAVLTINSDSRWGKNTSATTGPLGNTSISSTLGGSIIIDGTTVWLVPYDNGAGVVPAAGDTITGAGGCTGELIGVWAAINTAPTAAGAAMPTTGFIKLKSISTSFADNEALTGTGMTADVDSSTGGYRGWLEIVGEDARSCTVPRLGDFTVTGDWFYLDDTTGSAGQILQAPNSGGTNTYYPAVEIETGVGTGIYEIYPAINAATVVNSSPWNNSDMGTDERCKFVEMMDSGRFRIGSDGSNNVGYVPPAGCRVRIPNLIFTNTTSANYAVNVIPHATVTTRYDFNTSTSGSVSIDKAMFNWYIRAQQAYSLNINNFYTQEQLYITECATEIVLNKVANGNFNHSDNHGLQVLDCSAGMQMVDCKFGRTGAVGTSDYSVLLDGVTGVRVTRGEFGPRSPRTSTTPYALYCSQCEDIIIDNPTIIGCRLAANISNGITIQDVVYADNYHGTTGTSYLSYCVYIATSNNFLIDGVSLFSGVANIAPYAGIILITDSSQGIIRNIGTFASPINLNSVNSTAYIIHATGRCSFITAKRLYAENVRSSAWVTNNTMDTWSLENIFSDYADTSLFLSNNSYARGCGCSWTTSGQQAVYGSHFYDAHDSTTTGYIGLAFNEKTIDEPSASTYTITGGSPKFTSTGNLKMSELADEIVYEMQYFCIGHTGFQNVSPLLYGTSTSNLTFEYDININDGSGFTGSYSALTGANLSAETMDPILGFKLRIKISVNTADPATVIRYLNLPTTSTTTTQAYQYPLSTLDVTFTGLQAGSVVMVLEAGTENQLAKLTETAGVAIYTFDSSMAGDSVDYAILAPGYVYQRQSSQTLPSANSSVPVVQQVDYIYDSGASATCSFDGVTKKITMDAAATTLDVVGMYSDYIDWALTATNLKYDFAFEQAGGRVIDSGAGTNIPAYTYLTNGWKVAPDEANHTLTVSGGILLVSGGGDPFDDTVGAYTVRINYQQPVQSIAISSGGGGGTTPAAVWSYATRELSSSGVTAVQSGLATSAEIAALNDLSAAEVNAEVDTALADYDAPTKAELDAAQTSIEANQQTINVGVQKASKLIPHSTDL